MSRNGRLAAAAMVVAWAAACARQEVPTGGPEDRRPPVIVDTYPAPFEVLDEVDGDVKFEFDERISERVSGTTLSDAVIVSPSSGDVSVSHGRTTLSVSMEGGFQPGVVYRVTVRALISDLFGNQLVDSFELVFSTGDTPVPTTLAGEAWERETGQGLSNAIVFATGADGLVHQSRTDGSGIFAFRYIPEGDYTITAFDDLNRDAKVDSVETQGVAIASLGTGDTVLVDIPALTPDTAAAVLTSVDVLDSVTVVLEFDDFLDPGVAVEGFDGVDVTISRDEGGALSVLRVFHEADYAAFIEVVADSFSVLDSIEAEEASAQAALEAEVAALLVGDSVAGEPTAVGTDAAADTVGGAAEVGADAENPPADTVVIDPSGDPSTLGAGRAVEVVARRAAVQERPGRRLPPRLQALGGATPGPNPDGRRIIPARRLVVQLQSPIEYDLEYEVEAGAVVNIFGLPGGGGLVPLVWEAPPPDTVSVDSLGADSLVAPDSGQVPDTARAADLATVDSLVRDDGGREYR